MFRIPSGVGVLVIGLLLSLSPNSEAAGRYYSGGHPYHNGYLFMPPSSAYEAVRIRPPFHYGVPAYYYPESYLGGQRYGFYPPATYQYAPAWRAPYYYMSRYGTPYVW